MNGVTSTNYKNNTNNNNKKKNGKSGNLNNVKYLGIIEAVSKDRLPYLFYKIASFNEITSNCKNNNRNTNKYNKKE